MAPTDICTRYSPAIAFWRGILYTMLMRYTQDDTLAAIKNSYGVILTIAQRLNCDWATARKYINRWESTRNAFTEEREIILDEAETVIHKAITGGDTQLAVGTAKWILSTLGKKRGYTEQSELIHGFGDDDNKLIIQFVGTEKTEKSE